jgi:hypothetical protein
MSAIGTGAAPAAVIVLLSSACSPSNPASTPAGPAAVNDREPRIVYHLTIEVLDLATRPLA